MCILYVAVPYTHLIRLLHRLIFSAGRKFHCPFSHKVFVAPLSPHSDHRQAIGSRSSRILWVLVQRNFFLWLSTFISFRFSGFPLTPLTFQSLLCKLYLFLFLVYFNIFFPKFFYCFFIVFPRLTCWSALIAISHDMCTIYRICLSAESSARNS